MKTSLVWTLILFTVSLFMVLPHTAAINPTKLGLPEGAVARLGMGKINDIKYSPDGKHLAVASSVGVWIYDAQTGEVINLITSTDRRVGGEPEPQVSPINSISFSPDGQLLAIGTQGNNIRIWDVKLGRYRHTHWVSGLQSLSFSPDGNILASGGTEILLWDPETGKRIPHQHFSIALTAFNRINSVVFSPDGQTLASADDDQTVHLWNAKTGGEPIHTLTAHTDKVLSVAFSPDGQTLASASDDETVRLWNAKTGEPIHTFSAYSAQQCVAFSPDGNILATGSFGSIRLWDVETAKRLHTLSGYSGAITGISFSPDGQTLAGGSDGGVLRLWDITGEPRPIITEHISSVRGVSFSPDGQTLAIQDQISNVHLWNARTEALHHTPFVSSSMAFSPDGQVLASQSHNTIDLWDLQTEALLDTITKDGISRGVSFSPDSQMIAAIDANGAVLLWDVKTKTLLHTFIAARTISISFSPDSQMIAGTSRTDVHLWDTKTGDILQEFTGERRIDSISFSPDSQTLAIASRTDVHLWDTKTGDILQEFTEGLVWDMAFSPNGQVLAVGTLTGVRLWDAKTGKILQTLQENSAESVVFSPDGKTLACSRSASATLWDTETGELLQELNGHTDSIYSVAFSPEGRTLASLSLDGTVLLWEIIPDPAEADSIAPPNDVSDAVDISGYTTTGSLPEGAKTRIGKGTLLDMQYTPDGKYLKVSSSIGRQIYDAETYQALGMQAFPKPIIGERTATDITKYVVISPDGTTVARQTENRRLIHLWDVETDTPLHTIAGNPNLRDYLLSFSPDGKKLVIGNGSAAYLWDVERGNLLHTFEDTYSQSYYSKNYCFSPDGTMLALGNPSHIRLWDVERGNLLHTFVQRVNYRHSIAFSPDGKTLVTGVTDGNLGDMIHVWDVETGTFLRNLNKRERTDGGGAVYSLAFSPDGRTLAGGQIDGKISLWSVGTGASLRATPAVANSIGSHPILNLAFSSDGETLAAGVEDGTLHLYDVKTATHIDTINYMPSNIRSIAFSPDGKTLAIGSGYNAGAISLWDTASSTLLHSFRADTSTVHSVVFSPDSKKLVTGGRDNHLRLWDVETGNLLRALPPRLLPNQAINEIHDLSFSPDGKTLAIVQDEFIDLRDMETDTILCSMFFPKVTLAARTLLSPNLSNGRFAFSPDGKTLVAGYSGHPSGILSFVDVERCALLTTEFGRLGNAPAYLFSGNRFKDIAFSPADGKRLMVLTEGEFVILSVEEITSPILMNHFDISPRGIGAFSPDGKMLATGVPALVSGGSEDSSLYVWDVNTGELIRTYESGPVRSLVFSPDSTMLASEGGSGTVLLWELTAPTEPEPEGLTADVNGDGQVNIQDLVAVAAALGQTGENAADVNGDGEVNIQDLVAVAAALGQAAAAPAAIRQQATEHLTAADVQHWIALAQQLDLTAPRTQRGLLFLQYLLAALTPQETLLLANYPNPFNPETWIPYQLAKPADVSIAIYAIDGTLVRALDLGHQPVGIYQAKSRAAYWDGRNAVGESVASGVYFYTLTAGDFTATRKMLIRK